MNTTQALWTVRDEIYAREINPEHLLRMLQELNGVETQTVQLKLSGNPWPTEGITRFVEWMLSYTLGVASPAACRIAKFIRRKLRSFRFDAKDYRDVRSMLNKLINGGRVIVCEGGESQLSSEVLHLSSIMDETWPNEAAFLILVYIAVRAGGGTFSLLWNDNSVEAEIGSFVYRLVG